MVAAMAPLDAPLAGLRFSLAGPGKVGSSLSRWAVAAGAELVAVAGRGALDTLETRGQDLLLLALPDAALPAAAAALARRPQAAVALHTSGSLDASVLAPLRAAGSAVGSLHPLKAFPEPLPDLAEARGVFFAVDGDPAARGLAWRLATAWGGVPGEVPPAARPLYHFAATLAAGGTVTLLAVAGEIAGRLGLPAAVTRGYLELARGAVTTAGRTLDTGRTLTAAITGPVARGDAAAFRRQIEALRANSPDKIPLARILARETLRQRAGLGEDLSAIEEALSETLEDETGS
ncbi:MAG: hypothetical protein QOF89_4002 [Acidobacteriota bacterium]|jgi:predicted short-subunit dehydrogenase-like oxidoreductase (DUF2520 family)|nr:hypothetical protein [Acidobacteriota bacterium]